MPRVTCCYFFFLIKEEKTASIRRAKTAPSPPSPVHHRRWHVVHVILQLGLAFEHRLP